MSEQPGNQSGESTEGAGEPPTWVQPATEAGAQAAAEAGAQAAAEPSPATEPEPAPAVPPPVPPPQMPPPAFDSDSASATAQPSDRPEVAVGAAFAGGFVLAMILRRLAR